MPKFKPNTSPFRMRSPFRKDDKSEIMAATDVEQGHQHTSASGIQTFKSVERLKKMGIQSAVFSPCGNRPYQGNFMTVMTSNAENLRLIFTGNR